MSVLRMCVDMYAFVYVSKELGNLTDELFFSSKFVPLTKKCFDNIFLI